MRVFTLITLFMSVQLSSAQVYRRASSCQNHQQAVVQKVVVQKVVDHHAVTPVIVSPILTNQNFQHLITPQFVGIQTFAGNVINLPVGSVFTVPTSPTAVINVQPSSLVVVQPVAVPQQTQVAPAPVQAPPTAAPAPAQPPQAKQPDVKIVLPSDTVSIPPGTKIIIDGREFEIPTAEKK